MYRDLGHPNPPKNSIVIYIDSIRYRSLFSASIDTGISFRHISTKMKKTKGGITTIRKMVVFTEKWILDNPIFIKKILNGEDINE